MKSDCWRRACPRALRGERHAHVEVHYMRPMGSEHIEMHTYSTGVLTSFTGGPPVLVIEGTLRVGDPLGPGLYRPADLPPDAAIVASSSAAPELRALPGWGLLVAK